MIYWILIIIGNIFILLMFGFMIYICLEIFWPTVIAPIMMIVILRNILWDYWKGIFTLNNEDFPIMF